MRIADLRAASPEVSSHLNNAKEGLVDALLNLTFRRVSGSGPDGQIVYGPKASVRFVSGFLLPRFEESGQEDETSDIHLSTHGLDCQIAVDANGTLSVQAEFSIYVRALPEWAEIVRRELEIFPNPSLRRNVEQAIREARAVRLVQVRAEEATKPADQRRPYRELQQELYRQLLAEHGVRVSSDSVVAESEEGETEGEAEGDADEAVRLAAEQGRYIFDNDEAAEELDVPSKWRRLQVRLQPLHVDLSDPNAVALAASAWSQGLQAAVVESAISWFATDEGRDSAYRPAFVRPSHYRDEAAWMAFLAHLRQTPPSIPDIVPNLDGLALRIQIEPDLRDASRQNLESYWRTTAEKSAGDGGSDLIMRFTR